MADLRCTIRVWDHTGWRMFSCGKKAKYIGYDKKGKRAYLCGTHKNFCERRGWKISAIIERIRRDGEP